eukprot:CAMPEP_0197836058 /NCGR_PEP_ID=MMETSP1437-20131217/27857_1 /TAXON_ID=49252 ORGANISM="Eucampia antarctica, Strain CCMP1452" /NCGR_SAMPLE_ID=MMETSP1437 /ASSEMBLY_ACC=CAM_ASM_001096 /LENGTH=61 /DNA_ID=CAMNT_0043441947 /DNA_START=80 /DNA_END=262 /DNA_ORIENTATION=+
MKTKVIYVESEIMGIHHAEYKVVRFSRKDATNDQSPNIWKAIDSISSEYSHDILTCTTKTC